MSRTSSLLRLGEISAVQTGPFGSQLHSSDYVDSGTPIITVEHIREMQISPDGVPLVSERDVRRLQKYQLCEGDLVFSRVGAIDRCAYIAANEDGWLFSGRLLRVRPVRSAIEPRYLLHFLSYDSSRAWILNHAVGSTMPCLNTSILSNTPIWVPELREQRRIVEILDVIDVQIRRTQQIMAKILRERVGLIGQLLASINEVDQPPLDQYLSRIDAGWSPDCPEVVPGDGEWGILKISAVSGGVYRPTESKRLPSNLVPRPALEVKDSDVLCVRANGVGELVGRVAYVESTPQRLMLSDKTLRLVPTAKLDGYFLSMILGSQNARRQIESRMGGSSSQRNISQAELRRIPVPVPDLTVQRRMSAIVQSADRSIEANQRTLDKLRLVRSGLATDLLGRRLRAHDGQPT